MIFWFIGTAAIIACAISARKTFGSSLEYGSGAIHQALIRKPQKEALESLQYHLSVLDGKLLTKVTYDHLRFLNDTALKMSHNIDKELVEASKTLSKSINLRELVDKKPDPAFSQQILSAIKELAETGNEIFIIPKEARMYSMKDKKTKIQAANRKVAVISASSEEIFELTKSSIPEKQMLAINYQNKSKKGKGQK